MNNKPQVYVVSAPSGTGKTTLNSRLIGENFAAIDISVSYTTRGKREGEIDGKDYCFISREEFELHIREGHMLEYANVFGNFYGTSLREIERIHRQGKKVLLEIDVQGWLQAKEKIPDAMSIFILPPDMKTIWKRLESRGTDSLEVRQKRFDTAREELAAGRHYQNFIINDNLDRAYGELRGIVLDGIKCSLSYNEGVAYLEKLLKEKP